MRSFIVFATVAVLLVGAAIGLVAWDRPLTSRRNPETEDAYVEGDYTGLSARVPGYIATLPVNDNQAVTAGQVIATLDDRDYRAQVAQAEANVAAARAELQSLAERIRIAALEVQEAEANVRGTEAELVRDQEEDRRQHVLLPSPVGLLRNVEQADATMRSRQASLRQAHANVDERRQQVAVMQSQEKSSEATLRQQQAALRLARLQLGWTVIRAPVDGVLGQRRVRVGQLVQPGIELAAETPLDSVWVNASFTEDQIEHLAPGQPARLRADTWPGIEILGHVDHLAPATGAQFAAIPADNTTGNYTKVVQRVEVKIVLDPARNPLRGQLRPGMSMLVRVTTNGREPDVRELR
jgi:membrane fusion protein, multidrug efflux system